MDEERMEARADAVREWVVPHGGFFLKPATSLAPALLGCLLLMDDPDPAAVTSGIIVETEAYTQEDPASHSRSGRTARSASMFLEGGRAYVYFIYGMHCCFNVSAGPAGIGEAVLVRALEPVGGIPLMESRRGLRGSARGLTDGPAKLCQALGITRGHDGADLVGTVGGGCGPRILLPGDAAPVECGKSARIGVSRAAERPWRFYVPGSPFLSRRPR